MSCEENNVYNNIQISQLYALFFKNLNKAFFSFILKTSPSISLKNADSNDGEMS